MTTKICTKCKIEKSIEEYQYIKSKNRYETQCKKCISDYKKQYRIKNIEKIKEKSKIYTELNKENANKRAKKYYTDNREKILQNLRIDYEENTEKYLNKSKKYREENIEIVSKRKKKYANENKDKISIYLKNRRIEKREEILSRERKYRENKKEEFKQYHKDYQEKNIDKIKKYRQKYYKSEAGILSKRNSENKRRTVERKGDVTTKQLIELKENAKKCYWCEMILKNKEFHIDHYIPISKGGKHTISNLVISCPSCNLSKGKKSPDEFANQIGKLL